MGYLVASLLLMLAGYAIPESISDRGNKIKNHIRPQVEKLYNKVKNNESYLNKLYEAYMNKNNNLISSLLSSAGFGPRATQIRKSINNNTKKYYEEKDFIDKQITNDTNKMSELESAYNAAGTSYSNNKAAAESSGYKSKTEQKLDKMAKNSLLYKQMNQAIRGGSSIWEIIKVINEKLEI